MILIIGLIFFWIITILFLIFTAKINKTVTKRMVILSILSIGYPLLIGISLFQSLDLLRIFCYV